MYYPMKIPANLTFILSSVSGHLFFAFRRGNGVTSPCEALVAGVLIVRHRSQAPASKRRSMQLERRRGEGIVAMARCIINCGHVKIGEMAGSIAEDKGVMPKTG